MDKIEREETAGIIDSIWIVPLSMSSSTKYCNQQEKFLIRVLSDKEIKFFDECYIECRGNFEHPIPDSCVEIFVNKIEKSAIDFARKRNFFSSKEEDLSDEDIAIRLQGWAVSIKLERIVWALRLLPKQQSRVGLGEFGIIKPLKSDTGHEAKEWSHMELAEFFPDLEDLIYPNGSVEISKKDFDEFEWLYKCLVSSKLEAPITSAIERFNISCTRTNKEDLLVDYVICLETLFGLNQKEGIGDKLSRRIAIHLRTLPGYPEFSKDPNDILDTMKVAYTIRSNIVHGCVKKSRVKSRENQISAELLKKLENYCKSAICSFIYPSGAKSYEDKIRDLDRL